MEAKFWLDHNEKMQILKTAGDFINYGFLIEIRRRSTKHTFKIVT